MKMMKLRILIVIAFVAVTSFCFGQKRPMKPLMRSGNNYYLSAGGNDANKGSKASPWKSIDQLNSIALHGGDSVFFEAGKTFKGNLVIDTFDAGERNRPVCISSYGVGKAVIDGGDLTAFMVTNSRFIKVSRLRFVGSGRKSGNTKDGVAIINSSFIDVKDLEISGFQKAGFLVYTSKNIEVKNVYAHENGYAGISVSGDNNKESCSKILVTGCTANNNPGDPTNFGNHSGNGIIAGFCNHVLIEYSSATNNGWDMPRIGNGPVGIWCYEADNLVIQYCISYGNKTSPGGGDGGGFDLDGGVTNCVIQNCLSYNNQGSGFGIFQYAGASNWHDNIIRNNISENDGNTSAAGANAFIWNSSHDTSQFKNLKFYNNILYNAKGAAISYASENENVDFTFYNNIFVAKDSLITGTDIVGKTVFLKNDWWSINGGFNMDGIRNFKAWARQMHQEQEKGKVVGFNENPHFKNAGKTTLITPQKLKSFDNYSIPQGSKLLQNLPVF